MKIHLHKITLAIGLICFLIAPIISQTTFDSKIEDSLRIKVSHIEYEGMLLELIDLKTNKTETIVNIIPQTQPKEIKDIWFDSQSCGFILDAAGLLQYRLYQKTESGWKIKGQEVILIKHQSRKVGFGGFKLLDTYTILLKDIYYEEEEYRIDYRIHVYDSKGNRRVLKQVDFNESKY